MTDEPEITEDATEDKEFWELMGIEGDDSEGDVVQEQQDEEIAEEDKLVKKLSAKMDGMQKKFEASILRERVKSFESSSNELEQDLFRTIASDVKDVEGFDKAMKLVKERAAKMQAEADKYKEQLERQAEEEVANAWGTGPVGTPTPRNVNEDERKKRIEAGDNKAALAALLENDPFIGNVI